MYLVVIEIMQSIQLFSKANVTQFFFWGRNVLINFEQCKGPWPQKKKKPPWWGPCHLAQKSKS